MNQPGGNTMGPPPGMKRFEIRPETCYDEMNFNIRIWEFPVAVQSMQEAVNETIDTKSTFDFVWGMNIGLPAKWRITFLNNRKPTNPIFGVVIHLVETGIPSHQPMFGVFDVEIRKSDGSTFLYAHGRPVNFNPPGKVFGGFRRLASIPDIITSKESVLVNKDHLNLHMTFKLFGPEQKTSSAIAKSVVSTGLSGCLLDLLNSGENADLEITHPDKRTFLAHKLILAARSPYLKKQFRLPIGTLEKLEPAGLSAVKIGSMRQVLRFIYGGVLDNSWKLNYENLLLTAKLLQLNDLISLLDCKLLEICTQQNTEQLIRLASLYNLKRTEDHVKMQIQKWAAEKAIKEAGGKQISSMENMEID